MRPAFTNSSKKLILSIAPLVTRRWGWTLAEVEMCWISVWQPCNHPPSTPPFPLNPNPLIFHTEKLSSIVRSVTNQDVRSTQSTPAPWDGQPQQNQSRDYRSSERWNYRDGREPSQRDSRDAQRERIERLAVPGQQHSRNESGAPTVSTTDFADLHTQNNRRHDYDIHSMETDLSTSRPAAAKNPIPPPIVTVRSEFPTLNRSRQQQSLTCLVTIEIPAGRWHPENGDTQQAPPVPPLPPDDSYASIKSPVSATTNHSRALPYESPEVLDEITEELRTRVDNWHGLEFSR